VNPELPNALANLRDIHGAAPVPWWPPAPGWWVLAAIVLLGLLWLARRWTAARRVRQRRQRLLDYLELLPQTLDPQAQPQAFLAAVNGVLKMVALRAFPDQPAARLKGREWVEFLAAGLEGSHVPEGFAALAEGPYMPQPQFDPETLGRSARQWIERHG
jgi:hypothetical protein